MRLADLGFVKTGGLEGSSLRGSRRLLRDLLCVGFMVEDRPSSAERVEATLGREFAGVVRASVQGPGPVRGLRPRRAA